MNTTFVAASANNFMSGRSAASIQRVVIHTTVGSRAAAIARFQNPTQQVSAHYIVGLDGGITQLVDEADTAFHAGEWDVNLTTIGVEHEDAGRYDDPRPDALYEASGALVRALCERYGIPIDRAHIVGHREVHATACPDALDIDRIVRIAAQEEDDMSAEQFKAILDKLDDVADSAAIYAGRAARGLDPVTGSPVDPAKRLIDPVAEIQAARAAARAGR